MKMDGKSFVIGVLIGIAVGAILSIVLMIVVLPSFVQPYTRLKVAAYQWASVNIDGIRYDFKYQPSAGYVAQSDGQREVGGFFAEVGKQIEWRGIEITVSEVHSDYVILLIKPL